RITKESKIITSSNDQNHRNTIDLKMYDNLRLTNFSDDQHDVMEQKPRDSIPTRCLRCRSPLKEPHHGLAIVTMAVVAQLMLLVSLSTPTQAASHFLNEFCDLQSKTLRNAKKFRTNPETFSIFLTSKNSLSSVRVLPQKAPQRQTPPPQAPINPSAMSFSFMQPTEQPPMQALGATGNETTSNSSAPGIGPSVPVATMMPSPEIIQQYQSPVLKQLNCSIIVVAPRSHGLLVTVNSIGLPHHHAKLGITLNYDSQQAQSVSLDGDVTSGKYLLTQSTSSKIAINLQSFAPIDWSRVSFDILFTVYKSKANSTGCPNKSWFDCGDNICVPSSLVCDNNRNCPNGNDEMIFYRCYTPLFWSIAASTTMALAIAVMIMIVIVVLRRRRAAEIASQSQFSNNLLQDSTSKAGLNYCDSEAGYLADNMTGGFENPVWLHTNTLTKQDSTRHVAAGTCCSMPAVSHVQVHHNQAPHSTALLVTNTQLRQAH
ncbi:hypothetical protein GZH46_01233, partial [Fragariocoptes setiger]